jgi:hypothetical protein
VSFLLTDLSGDVAGDLDATASATLPTVPPAIATTPGEVALPTSPAVPGVPGAGEQPVPAPTPSPEVTATPLGDDPANVSPPLEPPPTLDAGGYPAPTARPVATLAPSGAEDEGGYPDPGASPAPVDEGGYPAPGAPPPLPTPDAPQSGNPADAPTDPLTDPPPAPPSDTGNVPPFPEPISDEQTLTAGLGLDVTRWQEIHGQPDASLGGPLEQYANGTFFVLLEDESLKTLEHRLPGPLPFEAARTDVAQFIPTDSELIETQGTPDEGTVTEVYRSNWLAMRHPQWFSTDPGRFTVRYDISEMGVETYTISAN